MLKEKLKIIIREFHARPLPKLIPRSRTVDLSLLDSPINKVIAVVGPRRAGKTYYLFQIMSELLEKGGDIQEIVYVNLEDERILPMASDDLGEIPDAWRELYGGEKRPLIFLDEIQNVPGWERFVRRMNDAGNRVFVTGSNSRMLASEIATSLRGRTLTHEIFPFSFPEYLRAKGVEVTPTAVYDDVRHSIRSLYEEYFHDGGYPEIAFIEGERTKGAVLRDYFNVVFYRDLLERYQIQNSDLLRLWMKTLMANISALVSFNKAENDFRSRGVKVSKATLSAYASYVEDIYFGFFVEMYSESVRKRQANPRKFYLIDQGLHNYLTLKFGENQGRLLENVVYIALRREQIQVYYYKTLSGQEVDFLQVDGKNRRLIQVCHEMERLQTLQREKKALLSAMEELGLEEGLILNLDVKKDEETPQGIIRYRPVWEWLLNPKASWQGVDE